MSRADWMGRLGLAILRRSNLAGLLLDQWQLERGADQPDPEGKYLKCYSEAVWVYTCVWAISQFGAQVPLRLYRVPPGKTEDDKELLPYDHPANVVLRHPNPATTRFEFFEGIRAYKELHGNAYILKDDGREVYEGPPTALWLMRPDRVKIVPNDLGLPSRYIYTRSGVERSFPPHQVVHLKFFSPYDPLYGQGTVAAARQTIMLDLNAQILNNALLKNGARMGGFFKIPGASDKKVREQFRAEVDLIHKGPKNAGKYGILWGDAEWKEMGVPLVDIQFIEGRKMNRDELLAMFGCYPAVVGVSQPDRARAEADMRMFANNTMMPKLVQDADKLTMDLFPDWEENIMAEHDWTNVPALREDMVAIGQVSTAVVDKGILSRGEARQIYFHREPFLGSSKVYQPAMLVEVGDTDMPAVQPKRSSREAAPPEPEQRPVTPYNRRRLIAYAKTLDALEYAFDGPVQAMFEKQRDVALARLKKFMATSPKASVRHVHDVFDEEAYGAISRPVIKRILWAAAEQGLIHAKEPLDWLETDFTIDSPALVHWLESVSANHVKLIDGVTRDDIAATLSEGVANGEKLKELTARINEVFDGRKENAATIARTEVQGGLQQTQLLFWRETDVIREKEWLPSGHPKTRHDNMTWVVDIEDKFTNLRTGKKMMTPGDPDAGEPGETINCLCDMAPVVSAEAKWEYLRRNLRDKVLPATGRGSRECQTQDNLRSLM
jgi:HK97 family phage portal protein